MVAIRALLSDTQTGEGGVRVPPGFCPKNRLAPGGPGLRVFWIWLEAKKTYGGASAEF